MDFYDSELGDVFLIKVGDKDSEEKSKKISRKIAYLNKLRELDSNKVDTKD